ncbi:MAG: hypothetical protein Q8L93_05785 [Rhodocyclaceae bacterium]|nr:hypothetical protein [Rhodocyclaceae bacterium]
MDQHAAILPDKSAGTTVTVLDLDKRAVSGKIKTGNRPKHPAVSPNGKWVMVNHWGLDDGKLRVSFIDTATDTVAKNIDIAVAGKAAGPTSMHNAWSYDSRYAFTLDRVDDNFVIIDTTDWSVKKIKTNSKPHYVSPSPDGKEVWLTVEGKDKTTERPGALVFEIGSFKQTARIVRTVAAVTAEGATGYRIDNAQVEPYPWKRRR